MSLFMRFFYLVIITLCFSASQGDVLTAGGGRPDKKRSRPSPAQRQEQRELARTRAASRRSFGEESERRTQADADLARAIAASLHDEDVCGATRRIRLRLEVIDDDNDSDGQPNQDLAVVRAQLADGTIHGLARDGGGASSGSAPAEAAHDALELVYASPEIDQLPGLDQYECMSCGIYALYFACVLTQDGIRAFDEETDRRAFSAFIEDVRRIKFQRSFGGRDVLRAHTRGIMYGQDELAFIAQQRAVRCWIGNFEDNFFDENVTFHSAADLCTLARQIRAGAAPATCVVFNTNGHWVTIFITPVKLYIVDSRNCEVRCETPAIRKFVDRVWRGVAV